MSSNRALSLEMLLPEGVTPDDFYVTLTALVAFFVVFVVGSSLFQRDSISPRVKALQERRAQLKGNLTAPRRRRMKSQESGINWIRNTVLKFKLLQQSQVGKIQRLLLNAGWRGKDTVYIFAFFQLVGPIVLFILTFLVVKIDFDDPMAAKWKWLMILGGTYLGMKLPTLLAMNARDKRYLMIQKGLPDALDLMMICAEAGLSLAAALDRVSRELGMAYPVLADELGLTSVEIGFLPDRKKALANLADRVDIQEVRGITSVLMQTEKYGTPIAQALRVLSAEFRTQRMLRAEQKAARLPAIMTIPMIVFILPTLFVVVISPAIIKLMDTVK